MPTPFAVTHAYSGHSEMIGEFATFEEAKAFFDKLLENWELQPHDQYLEIYDFNNDGEELLVHIFNEGNWECEE